MHWRMSGISQSRWTERNGESTFGDLSTVVLCFNYARGVIGIYVEGIEPGADVIDRAEVLVMVSLLSPGARYRRTRGINRLVSP